MKKQLTAVLIASAVFAGCSRPPSPTLEEEVRAWETPLPETTIDYTPQPKPLYSLIDKSDQRLYIISDGYVVREFMVATGRAHGDKQQRDDNRTPEGEFILDEPVDSSQWRYEGRLAYGPYFFRVEGSPWKGIGLHGTAGSVGKPKSHGCIRMRTPDLLEFKENYYQPSMKLVIRE